MSKYSPERLAGLKTMPKLPEGQKTTAVRVSGDVEVIDWAASLTPAERGRIFQLAYVNQGKEQHAYASESKPKRPKAPKPTASAAPGGAGPTSAAVPDPAATPLHADQMQVTGRKLTTPQTMICAGLQMPGAVAEYDTHERRWMVGFAGAPVKQDDLEELARLGVLEVTGEGKGAVYKLAEQQPKAAKARKKLRAVGERLPDTDTFLSERRKDSRDDH